MQQKIIYSNLTELIGRTSMTDALMQCGKNDLSASDYEVFRDFCIAATLLDHSDILKRANCILKQVFQLEERINVQACDAIWKETSQRMMEQSILYQDIVEGDDCMIFPTELPESVGGYDVTNLVETNAKSRCEWEAELLERMHALIKNGNQTFFYSLSSSYQDQRPNPYLVETILFKQDRNSQEIHCLQAQLLRILFAFCKQNRVTLLLSVACKPQDFGSLFERLKREVGYPTIFCASHNIDCVNTVIELSKHNTEIRLAVDRAAYTSESGLWQAVLSYAQSYPLGRMRIIKQS